VVAPRHEHGDDAGRTPLGGHVGCSVDRDRGGDSPSHARRHLDSRPVGFPTHRHGYGGTDHDRAGHGDGDTVHPDSLVLPSGLGTFPGRS